MGFHGCACTYPLIANLRHGRYSRPDHGQPRGADGTRSASIGRDRLSRCGGLFSTRAAVQMHHFIFNLADGNREQAKSFLHAKRWVVSRDEHHRDALAPGDLALVFVALTREFVGRVELKTMFLDPM